MKPEEGDDLASTGQVTQLLNAWCSGEESALNQLAPIVEAELRRLARIYLSKEQPGHLLQPTALINEVYLRLINWKTVEWTNRAHFYAVAAKMMRRILVNNAMSQGRKKRIDPAIVISLEEAGHPPHRSANIVELDEALQKLARFDARKSQLVELRFFGGLTAEETATVLDISVRTMHREWDLARSWLFRELGGSPDV